MSEFTSFFNLCSLQDAKQFLGVAKDFDDGNIIITFGKNIIIIVKVSTQKQVKSWTVLDKMSSKVIYDFKTGKYVGVFGGKNVRLWDSDTKDLNLVKKIKFQKDVLELLSFDNGETVVLYTDGSCESLSCAVENAKSSKTNSIPPILRDEQTISNPRLCVLSTGRKLMTFFAKHSKTEMVELYVFNLCNFKLTPRGKPRKYLLSRREQGVNLTGYAVYDSAEYPLAFTIWSDGRIFTLPLRKETRKEDAPGNFISMIENLKVNNPLTIFGVSTDCVAIYGANTNQEGACLLLYSTQYKLVKAKQLFKLYFKYCGIWVVEDHIVLSIGQNLSVVKYRVSRELLSEMLGSQIKSEACSEVGNDFINEEDELEENIMLAANKKINSRNCVETDTDTTEPNHTVCENYENLKKNVRHLCCQINHVEIKSQHNFINDATLIDPKCRGNEFGTKVALLLAENLKSFGSSEEEITAKIIPLLMEASCARDIIQCFERYVSISPKSVIDVLAYALSLPHQNGEFHDDNLKRSIIYQIISCVVDKEIVLPHIRKKINFVNIFGLMSYLFDLIHKPDVVTQDRPDTDICCDPEILILKWFGIILDSHYQEFVLIKNDQILSLLTKWNEMLIFLKENLSSFVGLSSIFQCLLEGSGFRSEQMYSKWYSIGEVKLY